MLRTNSCRDKFNDVAKQSFVDLNDVDEMWISLRDGKKLYYKKKRARRDFVVNFGGEERHFTD
jgi:hypothetical protein